MAGARVKGASCLSCGACSLSWPQRRLLAPSCEPTYLLLEYLS